MRDEANVVRVLLVVIACRVIGVDWTLGPNPVTSEERRGGLSLSGVKGKCQHGQEECAWPHTRGRNSRGSIAGCQSDRGDRSGWAKTILPCDN